MAFKPVVICCVCIPDRGKSLVGAGIEAPNFHKTKRGCIISFHRISPAV